MPAEVYSLKSQKEGQENKEEVKELGGPPKGPLVILAFLLALL